MIENSEIHIFPKGGGQNYEKIKEYVNTYFKHDLKLIIYMST